MYQWLDSRSENWVGICQVEFANMAFQAKGKLQHQTGYSGYVCIAKEPERQFWTLLRRNWRALKCTWMEECCETCCRRWLTHETLWKDEMEVKRTQDAAEVVVSSSECLFYCGAGRKAKSKGWTSLKSWDLCNFASDGCQHQRRHKSPVNTSISMHYISI